MERTNSQKAIWVFTPSRTAPEDLEFILVQRHKLLQDAVERVRESALTDHKHHLLFVGPRGCGKTHLVTLIVSRLSEDDALADRLRIAWLNEDETCTTLLELLFKIQAALKKRYPGEYRADMLGAAYDMKEDDAKDFVAKHLLDFLGSRTLLVVTENLDAIFDGLGDAGQKQLRAFIQENPKLSIVATAQRLVEDLSSRTSPFFGFFQTEHLKPLNVEEATELLQNIARLNGKADVVEFLSTSRGRSRVRALHHLSGGNHRIYIVLSQFITRDSIDALLGPFMKMVDELTPYYQERVRWLPPLQRKIVEYLCSCEGTVPVKEIAKRLFATPQTISSQLQDLREKGYVESNQRGRESLYEISEPLMRICVEVKETQSHEPLRLLVDFLRVWYDDKELNHRLGKTEPASASHTYLESALQRNKDEGNLRTRLILDDLGFSLPEAIPAKLLDAWCSSLPEGLFLSAQFLKEGNESEALKCLAESISEEDNPSNRGRLLVARGLLLGDLGERGKAIEDFASVIGISGAAVEEVAWALLHRGIAYGKTGETQREIEDYTRVIELAGAPPEQVAKALVNRGITHGQQGDSAAEIADYTRVIELAGAPLEPVAKALFNRGITHGQQGESAAAIADYTRVIELAGAPLEQVAKALINRGATRGQQGGSAAATADYTRVIELAGAPLEQVATALYNRGITHWQQGESAAATADYTRVIELAGAPLEQVAQALINRGITHGHQGESAAAIADYTRVIELAGAPLEQVAKALFNRGITHGQQGESAAEIADFTRVIELAGAPLEQVAKALINRGATHRQQGESAAEIADYTRVIELAGAPLELVVQALFYRGVTLFQIGHNAESSSDFERLIQTEDAPAKMVIDAYLALAEIHWSEGRWPEGFKTLNAGLERGSKEVPPYYETSSDLIGVVFSAGLSPEGRIAKVAEVLGIYAKYLAQPVLGEAVVQHIGQVFRAGEPLPSSDNLEQWAAAWEQAAESVPEFRLSVRLLRTAIDFVKSGGKDPGVLLNLTSAERSIVKQALGLESELSLLTSAAT